jgi:hypothetical protein
MVSRHANPYGRDLVHITAPGWTFGTWSPFAFVRYRWFRDALTDEIYLSAWPQDGVEQWFLVWPEAVAE